MADMDTPRFRISAAAKVSGFDPATLRQYMDRQFKWEEGDARARSVGVASLLSLRSVIRLAVTHAVWACGVHPRDAFNAAIRFTDFGSGSRYAHMGEVRMPCALFDSARFDTWLVWCPAKTIGEVIPVAHGGGVQVEALTSDLFGNGCGGVLLVPLNAIVTDCLAKIGQVKGGTPADGGEQ